MNKYIILLIGTFLTALNLDSLAQEKTYIGDYYLYGWIHNVYNFNKLNVTAPYAEVSINKVGQTRFGSMGIGMKIQKRDYLTFEIGRMSTDFEFVFNNTIGQYQVHGAAYPKSVSLRLGYERIYHYKKIIGTVNVGVHSWATNFNGHINDIWIPYEAELMSKRSVLFGPSLNLSIEYPFLRRFAVFARIQGNMVINSNQLHQLRMYNSVDFGDDIEYFQIKTEPYTFNAGLGIKIGLEHKSYYQK